ncbi:hypothetical protein ACFL4V_00120 [Candidatus Latescibacterota bacterium]
MQTRRAFIRKTANFVVLYEPYRNRTKLSEFKRFDVQNETGNTLEGALGVIVTLDGKSYEVILNPDKKLVQTVKGTSRKILSVVRN